MAFKFIFVNSDGDREEELGYAADEFSASGGGGAENAPALLNASGVFADSMIGASSVTQHVGSIDHDQLLNFVSNEHIDWTGASAGTIDPTNYSSALLIDGSRDLTGVLEYSTDQSGSYTSRSLVDKAYADNIAAGFGPKRSVRVATVEDLATSYATGVTYANETGGVGATLTEDDATDGSINDGSIDGLTDLIVGDRVLVKSQTTTLQNGIYEVTTLGDGSTTPWVLTRSTDFDNSPDGEIRPGDTVPIEDGDTLAGYIFYQVDFDTSDSVGTDSITFSFFSNPASLTPGDGIDIVSSVISVDVTDLLGEGITEDTNNIAIDWSTAFNDSKAVKASDLSSVSNGFGASIIGIEDAGTYTDETDVEGALQELYGLISERGVTYTVGTGGVTKGDLVYISANDTVLPYDNITVAQAVVGIAATTVSAGNPVKVLANDTVITSILGGSAAAGTKYYWNGSSGWTNSFATFSTGDYIWLGGVAKNGNDVAVEVTFIMKKG